MYESTAVDSVERKRALSRRGRASLMHAARPNLQIEAYRYACKYATGVAHINVMTPHNVNLTPATTATNAISTQRGTIPQTN